MSNEFVGNELDEILKILEVENASQAITLIKALLENKALVSFNKDGSTFVDENLTIGNLLEITASLESLKNRILSSKLRLSQ